MNQLHSKEWLEHKYVTENMTAYAIAGILGCDQKKVNRWLKKHGIPMRSRGRQAGQPNARSWSAEECEKLREMWNAGIPTEEIADALGRTYVAVSLRVPKLGLKPRPYGGLRTPLVHRKNGGLKKIVPAIKLLNPNTKGYFDSAAAVRRFLELKGAA